jgi:hypothetical protein
MMVQLPKNSPLTEVDQGSRERSPITLPVKADKVLLYHSSTRAVEVEDSP